MAARIDWTGRGAAGWVVALPTGSFSVLFMFSKSNLLPSSLFLFLLCWPWSVLSERTDSTGSCAYAPTSITKQRGQFVASSELALLALVRRQRPGDCQTLRPHQKRKNLAAP